MSPSSSERFQLLFEEALQHYEKQTKTKLLDHALAKQLEKCDSVDSITSVLQTQARVFLEFRGDDRKIMKSLKRAVYVLHTLSTSILSVGIPFPPVNAVFAGFALLLAAVKDVSSSYDALVDLFESIENFLSRLDIYTKMDLTEAVTDIVVKILVEILATLALATKQVRQGRLRKFVKKLLGENDIEAVLQRLDRLTLDEARATGAQTLEVVYGLLQHRRVVMDDLDAKASADNIREALEIMQQVASEINKSKRERLQKDIRKWLSPPDPWKNHNIALGYRLSGTATATWWIQGDKFSEWKYSGPSSLLWIHGKPGAGKSVLCSSIIQVIRGMCDSGLAALAFFYCDFRDDEKKDRHGLLSSLLVQLCAQSDAYCTVLSEFYLAHGSGSQHASDDELLQCLRRMVELQGQATAYIVVDALDECPTTTGMPSPREGVLELVKQLVGLRVSNLRICVTSRHETDIVPILGPLAFHSISLHEESGQIRDIEEYVKSVVNTDPKMLKWREADRRLVIEVLTRKADGMFRWVFCQLEYLRHCCLRQRIQSALRELPDTLDATYERTLQDIGRNNREFAHRLFQCVAAASRPLRVDELAEFLAFEFDAESTPIFREDLREEDPAHAVLSTCTSLLSIVDVDGSPVVQFAHFSVKEYLTSKRLAEAKDPISQFHVSLTPAHTTIAQACLGVLLHLGEDVTKDSLKNFPLTEYAAEHWVDHALFAGVSASITDGTKRLFDPDKRHLAVWVWVYDPELPGRRYNWPECPPQARASPLHYAAFCGLCDVLKFLIVERSEDINARGFDRNETPLAVASRMGYLKVVKVLLKYDAETEARDNKDWSSLHQASDQGHAEVARALLERGADVRAQTWLANTALDLASNAGQMAVFPVLLKHGADARALGQRNTTPLHWALSDRVARFLLECGADANARDINNGTPLHWASEYGHADVAQVILEHGGDANARDSEERTPLHLASRRGYLDIVRSLLQHDSDVHARDNKGRTAFKVASRKGHHGVMQLLLERGAERR